MSVAARLLRSRSNMFAGHVTLLLLLLLQPCFSLADGDDSVEEIDDDENRSLRYVFPFYPRELDILIGHLQTEIYRLEESLKTCDEINEGNHEAGNRVIDMYDSGNTIDVPSDRDEKLELIATLRITIREKEAALEKCRFNFWTGGDIE